MRIFLGVGLDDPQVLREDSLAGAQTHHIGWIVADSHLVVDLRERAANFIGGKAIDLLAEGFERGVGGDELRFKISVGAKIPAAAATTTAFTHAATTGT